MAWPQVPLLTASAFSLTANGSRGCQKLADVALSQRSQLYFTDMKQSTHVFPLRVHYLLQGIMERAFTASLSLGHIGCISAAEIWGIRRPPLPIHSNQKCRKEWSLTFQRLHHLLILIICTCT